jgi:uncharacterized integral membrane protein
MIPQQILCLLLILLAADSAAFSPTRHNGHLLIQHVTKLTNTALYTKLTPIPDDEKNAEGELTIQSQNINIPLTTPQKTQVILYRLGLSASALLLSINAIGDASFLEGTGIDVSTISQIVQQSHRLLPIVMGASLAFCTVPNIRPIQSMTKMLSIGTVATGVFSILVSEETIQTSWTLTWLILLAISIREIYYFGLEYKQECVLVLVMLPFMWDGKVDNPFVMPLCGLGLSVLAAGKIFEPLREDLVCSNSEFLAK